MFVAYFVLLKVFLIVFYFINSLFKRKSEYKLTQVSIEISKTSYFYFSFKLNEKKKVPLRKYDLGRRGTDYKKNFVDLS